ncbi:MAG: hypothetical protein KGN76_00935 [Acidobacteriota bacterium]|nr:hypothetical protein [Acidobacteriota bacterium]
MNKLLATVDEDFAQIDRLVKELRHRIARASEVVHVAADKVARSSARPRKAQKRPAKIRGAR